MAFSVQIPSLGIQIVYMGHEHDLPTPCSVMRYWRGCVTFPREQCSVRLSEAAKASHPCGISTKLLNWGRGKERKTGQEVFSRAQGMSLKTGKREGGRARCQ